MDLDVFFKFLFAGLIIGAVVIVFTIALTSLNSSAITSEKDTIVNETIYLTNHTFIPTSIANLSEVRFSEADLIICED